MDTDCVICLGLVLAGDTSHHEVIAHSTANKLHDLSCQSFTPIINGIIVVNNEEQAEARCGQKMNRGTEFALAAIDMLRFQETVEPLDIFGDADNLFSAEDLFEEDLDR